MFDAAEFKENIKKFYEQPGAEACLWDGNREHTIHDVTIESSTGIVPILKSDSEGGEPPKFYFVEGGFRWERYSASEFFNKSYYLLSEKLKFKITPEQEFEGFIATSVTRLMGNRITFLLSSVQDVKEFPFKLGITEEGEYYDMEGSVTKSAR